MAVRGGASQEELRNELYHLLDNEDITQIKIFMEFYFVGDFIEYDVDILKKLIDSLDISEYMYDRNVDILYMTFEHTTNFKTIFNSIIQRN